MDRTIVLKRLRFRAWHRGTKEADLIVGGFFDRYSVDWSDAEIAWFDALLDEEDVDVMAWAMGIEPMPERYHGTMMDQFKRLDFIPVAK